MSALAPTYLKTDVPTAQTMINTGFKLSHGNSDLVGQVRSLAHKEAFSALRKVLTSNLWNLTGVNCMSL